MEFGPDDHLENVLRRLTRSDCFHEGRILGMQC